MTWNESVLIEAGVKREQLDTVKARKLAYCGHTMRKQGSCLEKEIMQRTMPGACRRRRPRMPLSGWTRSRRGRDSPWKSQSVWQRAEITGESTSIVCILIFRMFSSCLFYSFVFYVCLCCVLYSCILFLCCLTWRNKEWLCGLPSDRGRLVRWFARNE